jgi:hypothetical protein
MFAIEGYGGGVEEGPQHPHHHQVYGAYSEHLEYKKIKILRLKVKISIIGRKQG